MNTDITEHLIGREYHDGASLMRVRLPLAVRGYSSLGQKPHAKPLKHPRYARAMTIALGVVCSNGVVLGTDLQYTTDDATKTPGQKMFWLCPGRPYSVLIAASGSPDSAKQVVELSEEAILSKYPDSIPTIRQIRACIEDSLREVYLGHIDTAPVNERAGMRCDLLVGIRVGREIQLLYSNRTRLIKEKDAKCFGIGLWFSNYALTQLLPLRPTLEVASQVVAYVIAMAKDYVEGVGHGSDIHTLHLDGTHDSLLLPEREEIEQAFRAAIKVLPHIVDCTDTDIVSDESVSLRADWLMKEIWKLRELHKKRKNRRLRMWLASQEAQRYQQSTTNDP
jgi:hypothetical protein